MSTFGQETLEIVGASITVSADGSPKAKNGGITIAWDEISAFAADATFHYEQVVKAGDKFLRYGTILQKIVGGSNAGKYAPAGITLAGGATFSTARGDVFILNESIHEYERASDFPSVIEGGRVYKNRLLVDFSGISAPVYDDTTSIGADVGANLFDKDDFLAAFPLITFVTE